MAFINGLETMFSARFGTGLSVDEIRDAFYPVGIVVECETSPASRIGGTWEKVKDKFVLAAGDVYAHGTSGGSATNTHNHYQTMGVSSAKTFFSLTQDGVPRTRGRAEEKSLYFNPTTNTNGNVRENSTHNETIDIMPPYLAVNTWRRIA